MIPESNLNKTKLILDKIGQMNPKHRDILKEALTENNRKSNYIRIYPTRNSDIYDQYFLVPKVFNRVQHKLLFSDEIVPLPIGYPGTQTEQAKTQNDE